MQIQTHTVLELTGGKNKAELLNNGDVKVWLNPKSKENFCLIDEYNWDRVKLFPWYLHSRGYAACRTIGKSIYMHRYIYDLPHDRSREVDHHNLNKSDNRMINLRITHKGMNSLNRRPPRTNKTGIKNIHWDKTRKKYVVSLVVNGKSRTKRRFVSLELAVQYKKRLFQTSPEDCKQYMRE